MERAENLKNLNSHGGLRSGAGRKRKTEKFVTQIQRAEKKIADKLPWVVDKMLELAEGVTVREFGPGGPIVYQRAPDLGALKYLADRIMGKPTERADVTVSTDEWVFDPTEATYPPSTNGKATPVLDE
jgi:hypothetical protein